MEWVLGGGILKCRHAWPRFYSIKLCKWDTRVYLLFRDKPMSSNLKLTQNYMKRQKLTQFDLRNNMIEFTKNFWSGTSSGVSKIAAKMSLKNLTGLSLFLFALPLLILADRLIFCKHVLACTWIKRKKLKKSF